MPALPSEVGDSYFWNQPYSRAAPYVTGENPTAERIADPWGCGGGRFYNSPLDRLCYLSMVLYSNLFYYSTRLLECITLLLNYSSIIHTMVYR